MGPWRWPVQPGDHRWPLGVVAEGCLRGGRGSSWGYDPVRTLATTYRDGDGGVGQTDAGGPLRPRYITP